MNYCPQTSYSVPIFGFWRNVDEVSALMWHSSTGYLIPSVLIQHWGLNFKGPNAHEESFVTLKTLHDDSTTLFWNAKNQMPKDESITSQKNSYITLHLLVSTMIHLPTCIIRLNVSLIGLNSLKRLRLQDNLIQQLPEEAMSNLEAMEQLSLRKNHLSTIPPKLFSHLKHLKHLDLSNNWISSVLVLTCEISTSTIVSPLQITEYYSNRWPVQSNTGVVKVFSVKTSQELLHIYRPERERLDMLNIIIIIVIVVIVIVITTTTIINHHLANTKLGHLLTHSSLIHLEVSLMVTPGFFCLLVCRFLYSWSSIMGHSVCMLQPISYICLYFVQNWGYIYLFCNLCVCFVICPSIPCCFSHIFHLCCCYSSWISSFNGPIFTTV